MKPEQTSDEPLRGVLRDWKVDSPLPPGFGEQVWQRIARQEAPAASRLQPSLTAWLGTLFSRRSLAVSYFVALLLIGATTGLVEVKIKSAAADSQWRARYVQSIDPYKMPMTAQSR